MEAIKGIRGMEPEERGGLDDVAGTVLGLLRQAHAGASGKRPGRAFCRAYLPGHERGVTVVRCYGGGMRLGTRSKSGFRRDVAGERGRGALLSARSCGSAVHERSFSLHLSREAASRVRAAAHEGAVPPMVLHELCSAPGADVPGCDPLSLLDVGVARVLRRSLRERGKGGPDLLELGVVEDDIGPIELLAQPAKQMVPSADDVVGGVGRDLLQRAMFREHDEGTKCARIHPKVFRERLDVRLVLLDRVVEALLRFGVERHRPVALVGLSEDPARVVLGPEDEHALLVEHDDVDFRCRRGPGCARDDHVREHGDPAELSMLECVFGQVFPKVALALECMWKLLEKAGLFPFCACDKAHVRFSCGAVVSDGIIFEGPVAFFIAQEIMKWP